MGPIGIYYKLETTWDLGIETTYFSSSFTDFGRYLRTTRRGFSLPVRKFDFEEILILNLRKKGIGHSSAKHFVHKIYLYVNFFALLIQIDDVKS